MEERIWHRAYDEGVPASIAYEQLPLPALLEQTARAHPGAEAIAFLNRRMTYAALFEEVRRFAGGLARLGVRKGDRVAIQLPNLPQTVIAFCAVQHLGAVSVMTNPQYKPREIEHQWKDAGCEVAVLADFVFDQELRELRARLPVRHYVVASIPDYLRFPLNLIAPLKLRRLSPPRCARVRREAGVHRFRDLVRVGAPRAPMASIDMDDTAALQYTGGTTGVSKGAMLTHRNLSCNVQQIRAWFTGIGEAQEVLLVALPLFHVFGLTVALLFALYTATKMVLIADPRDFARIVSSIERHRVTLFPAVPAMFNAINHLPGIEARGLRSVKACFSGSAPLPLEVQQRFEALTGCVIVEGFGMTETSPVTHVNPLLGTRKIGTIGVPVSDTDARIVDVESGTEPRPDGEPGELVVRGPQVMQGYFGRDDETALAIRGGWMHTGDLAVRDEQGYFRIVGRKKDMILCGGYNVYPDEIDQVLMAHESILEAATIGVPDERRGETVKSFIVLKPGATLSAAEVEAHCRANLAAYKVPREIEFLSALPKSSVLKVLRRELRERERERRSR